jgi:Uma2 family endonuclease
MSTQGRNSSQEEIVYPESDGQPMAENTLQFEWITTIKGGLDAVFRDDPNVFVAGDLLWYPVEGDNTIRTAPDALVVIGRPKGYRDSYQQWREQGIAPQVVFEVLSPGNRLGEMMQKLRFYERYGVEEYYIYDPDRVELTGWIRNGEQFDEIPDMAGWVSPRLAIRFELAHDELRIYGPDGRPFATYLELVRQREELLRQRQEMVQERDAERLRADRLAAQLRALGVEPER